MVPADRKGCVREAGLWFFLLRPATADTIAARNRVRVIAAGSGCGGSRPGHPSGEHWAPGHALSKMLFPANTIATLPSVCTSLHNSAPQ